MLKTFLPILLFIPLSSLALNQSFWLDEAASLSLANRSLSSLFSVIRGDFHPPLFYLLLLPFLRAGITAEWALRLPNLMISVASLVIFQQIVKQIRLKHPTLALLLLATNPFFLYYSIELRMYPLSLLLTLISWYTLLKPSLTRQWRLLFFLSTLLHFYTFYGAVFVYASQGLYIYFARKNLCRFFLISSFFLLLGFLPWVPVLSVQLQGGRYLTSHLPGWTSLSGVVSPKSILLIFAKFVSGRINLSFSPLIFTFVALHTSLVLIAIIKGLFVRPKPLLYWLLVPLFLALLVSLYSPMLGYWRFLYLLPAVVLITSIGINRLTFSLILILNLIAWVIFLLTPSFHREDWRDALNWVVGDNSVIVVAFSDRFAPVAWYAPNQPVIAPLKNLTLPADLDQTIQTQALPYTQIYYFDYLSDLTDPQRLIKSSLDRAGFIPVTSRSFTGIGSVTLLKTLPL
ncbi:hypothetical protein A2368_04035 [Candidatus Collierbacteria bacterium RIFOXYB1_FULL_49_13]|uniref:Glycosyltransferase RgtA/B/C/D-like domain-containing protein n=1 Tax=Candidatus Collierbacteria bacterium RIFOXYB1_FULL_49_13 TaxID=1817728 RepID=A0A1F5FF02_9BACT|nr:MAG: hypothetical protein A2368_04035 [Candidatus Collierbacteria bacterium RIFOXYB1_FULL_49_13]